MGYPRHLSAAHAPADPSRARAHARPNVARAIPRELIVFTHSYGVDDFFPFAPLPPAFDGVMEEPEKTGHPVPFTLIERSGQNYVREGWGVGELRAAGGGKRAAGGCGSANLKRKPQCQLYAPRVHSGATVSSS
jgi:hypothetical protein